MKKEPTYLAASTTVETLGIIAFHVSLAAYPQYVEKYAWVVKYMWALWAITLLLWIRMWAVRRHDKAQTSASAPPAIPQAKSQSIVKSSGNATVTQHFYGLTTEPVPPKSPAITHALPAARHIEVELLEVEVRRLTVSLDDDAFYFNKQGDRTGTGIVLPVHFNPFKSAPDTVMENVTASLVLTNLESQKKIRIEHGVWVGTAFDAQTLRAGETKHLVLAIFDGSTWAAISTSRVEASLYKADGDDPYDPTELATALYTVEVVLRWWKNNPAFKFELDLPKIDLEEKTTRPPTP